MRHSGRPRTRPSRPRVRGAHAGAAVALGAAALAAGPAAEAATYAVTNLNDAGAGSLRQAIADANGNAGADTVTFQAGLSGTIALTSGQLVVSDSVDIQGPGATQLAVDAGGTSRVFYVYNPSALIEVTISGLTITGGSAEFGGGVADQDESLTLDAVFVTGNEAVFGGTSGDGGGLWFDGSDVAIVIRDSDISGNAADEDGGGAYFGTTGNSITIERTAFRNNTAHDGGGIYFYDVDHPSLLEDVIVSGNTAIGAGGGIYLYDGGPMTISRTTISGNSAPEGGGMFMKQIDEPLTLENTTISGNTATSGAGGGLFLFYNSSFYTVELRHVTIAGNSAATVGGGFFDQGLTVSLANSIVADNAAPSDPDLATAGDASFDLRYTLVENAGAANVSDNGGNLFALDPQLGPLQNNGGVTRTQLPAAGSPVIDAGDPAFVPPPSVDQRGQARVFGGAIDLGAVEVGASSAVEIPTLGGAGEVALGGLVGLAGLAALRRRRRQPSAG